MIDDHKQQHEITWQYQDQISKDIISNESREFLMGMILSPGNITFENVNNDVFISCLASKLLKFRYLPSDLPELIKKDYTIVVGNRIYHFNNKDIWLGFLFMYLKIKTKPQYMQVYVNGICISNNFEK